MALEFKTPSQVAEEYLTHLKGLKPSVNTAQTDSEWWIKSRVIGGVVSGIYGDQKKLADDPFPQSARSEAIERHLQTYFNEGFTPATKAVGDVLLVGDLGTVIGVGAIEFVYAPNGNTYVNTEAVTLVGPNPTGATGVVAVESINLGQSQNLLESAELSISSPPAGIESTATVYAADLAGGRDQESPDEASVRILARIRNPISGGTKTDYEQWAFEASDQVTSSKVFRHIRGLGTVGVSVTAGTTDIDTALDEGQAIVRIPTQDILDGVEAYLETVKPLTDCVTVLAPSEVSQNVTVNVSFAEGYDENSVIGGETLSLGEIVEREVKRALYKLPIGGRLINNLGYVVAAEIEEAIDLKLSALPFAEGSIGQVLIDRQVQDLAGSGTNRLLAENEIVIPGTITVVVI